MKKFKSILLLFLCFAGNRVFGQSSGAPDRYTNDGPDTTPTITTTATSRVLEHTPPSISSQNEPPTIYNPLVEPGVAARGSGVVFHYRIFYQDSEGQPPAIRNLYLNESSEPLQMQIAADGDYTSGKELYYDLSVDSPLLINGANHYYIEVSDDNTQNLVRSPETGFYASPFVGTDFDAEFKGEPTSGSAPLKVQFTDLSTGDITGWSWSFGDGGGAISRNPYYIYNNPGTYTVSLKVLGPAGSNTETKTDYIVVQGGNIPPTANFSASPTTGMAPLTVQFTNLSTGDITDYSWTFGDGGTSTLANPSHTYNSDGTYTVGLTVTGPAGTHSTIKPSLIKVGSQPPVANFTASPRTGDQPLAVQFSDISSGNITGWSWFFGDGGSSTLANPGHTYTQAGTFTVSLTVNGPGGSDSVEKTDFITVNPTSGAVADFSAAPTAGNKPLSVQFTDLSTGNITGRTWNFGDGGSSTALNPNHTYQQEGSYSVSLTVTGPDGNNTLTRNNYINVTSGGGAPVANFSASPTSGNAPLAVQFTDQSSGNITSRTWNFGDGGSSTAANPNHTYNQAGNYTVSLTVTGPGGSNTHTKSSYINVTSAGSGPVADFSASPRSGDAPLAVKFTDQSSGDITSRTWNFGDGGSSTAANPNHTYNQPGSYTVGLTVVGPQGSHTRTKSNYISVTQTGNQPVADFSGSPTAGNSPLTVQFTDKSSGEISNRTWDFGDGGTGTAKNPQYTYLAIGSYTVKLTVRGPQGTDTKTRSDYISVTDTQANLQANFWATPLSGNVPLNVQFADKSVGRVTKWIWDFGDGHSSTEPNPRHKYDNAGFYNIGLTVQGPAGTDTKIRRNFIEVFRTAGLESVDVSTPANFSMINYPNPFNANTTVHVAMPKAEWVEIDVLNLKGEQVDRLYTGELSAGYHTLRWHPSHLPSNVYFIRIKSSVYKKLTKCILLK